MNKNEIETQIQKLLNNTKDSILRDILVFLKELQNQPDLELELTHSLHQILAEDKGLLEELAE